jgi:Carboxypeptidase regulatory-like domain
VRTFDSPFRAALRIFAVCLFSSTISAFAAVAGSISGTVKDASGLVVPWAHVKIAEASTGLSYETQTGSNGSFMYCQ